MFEIAPSVLEAYRTITRPASSGRAKAADRAAAVRHIGPDWGRRNRGIEVVFEAIGWQGEGLLLDY